jgi:hypothetical protein
VARPADPVSRLNVDLFSDEADFRTPVVEGDEGVLRFLEEDRLPGQSRQRAELENESPDLGRVRARAAGLAGLQVDVHVGHARGRVEDGQKARSKLLRQAQKAGVPCHLVAGEESSQEADRDLEILDRDVPVEGELFDDQGFRLLGLVLETQKNQRIQRIDRRHEEWAAIPVAGGPAHGPQLVVTPGVPLVGLPGEEKFLPDSRSELGAVD